MVDAFPQLIIGSCQCSLKKVEKVGPLSMQTGAMQNETGGTAAHAGVLGAEDVAEDCPEGGAGTEGTACAGVLGARRMATIHSDRPSRLASSTPPFDSA